MMCGYLDVRMKVRQASFDRLSLNVIYSTGKR
jgi:hypothetical protein